MASTKTSFQSIANVLCQKGDIRDTDQGNHSLICVSSKTIEKALEDASNRGNSVFWGVLCVLLRLRYGNFVFEKRGSSRLKETRSESRDDLDFAFKGIFSHILAEYGDNLQHLKLLFNGVRSVKLDVLKSLTEKKGFKLQIGISILVFLRDHGKKLPKFKNIFPEREEVLEILFPVLWAAFVEKKEDFTRDGFFLFQKGARGSDGLNPVLENGQLGMTKEVHPSSCYRSRNRDLVISNENADFVALVSPDASKQLLEMAGGKNFNSLCEEIFGVLPSQEEQKEQVEDTTSAPIPELTAQEEPNQFLTPILEDEDAEDAEIVTNPKLKELENLVESLRREISAFNEQRLNAQRLISRLDHEIETERNRHRDAMVKLNGERQDTNSTLNSVQKQLEEFEAGLRKLGFNS
jgi:hypothetical protein